MYGIFMAHFSPTGSTLLDQIIDGNFIGALDSGEIRKVLCLDSEELWNSWDLEAIAAHVSASLNSKNIDSR